MSNKPDKWHEPLTMMYCTETFGQFPRFLGLIRMTRLTKRKVHNYRHSIFQLTKKDPFWWRLGCFSSITMTEPCQLTSGIPDKQTLTFWQPVLSKYKPAFPKVWWCLNGGEEKCAITTEPNRASGRHMKRARKPMEEKPAPYDRLKIKFIGKISRLMHLVQIWNTQDFSAPYAIFSNHN